MPTTLFLMHEYLFLLFSIVSLYFFFWWNCFFVLYNKVASFFVEELVKAELWCLKAFYIMVSSTFPLLL